MATQNIKLRSKGKQVTEKEKDKSKSKNTKKKSSLSFWFLFIALIMLSFIIGSMLGYGVLGERDPFDIFDMDTWSHMYHLIFG